MRLKKGFLKEKVLLLRITIRYQSVKGGEKNDKQKTFNNGFIGLRRRDAI